MKVGEAGSNGGIGLVLMGRGEAGSDGGRGGRPFTMEVGKISWFQWRWGKGWGGGGQAGLFTMEVGKIICG